MENNKKNTCDYYAFLDIVQKISLKVNSIQRSAASIVLKNYNLNEFMTKLEKEIASINECIGN